MAETAEFAYPFTAKVCFRGAMLSKFIFRNTFRAMRCVPEITRNLAFSPEKSTLDDQKMFLFKTRSSTWWDEKGEWRSLHALNELRIPMILDGLIDAGNVTKEMIDTPKPLQDLLILDAGCGGGILAEPMAKLGGIVTGVDPVAELIEEARHHAKLDPSLSNLMYHVGTIEEHALGNSEKYDAVVVCEVLAHVGEQELFLESCIKCLKPGGSIFVSSINKTVATWLLGTIVRERIARSVPRGIHRWDRLIAPYRTKTILANNGCKPKSIRGFGYNPFNNRWYWRASNSLYYVWHAIKC